MKIIKSLIWDHFNLEHIKKHGVEPREIDEILSQDVITLSGHQERLLVLGRTFENRLLTLVLDSIGEDSAYLVTARPMSKKERSFYQTMQGGQND